MAYVRPPLHALYHYYCEFDAWDLICRHQTANIRPQPGTVTNFLGVRVPAEVLPKRHASLLGTVEGLPDPSNWHADIAEWAAALLSVEQASTRYRIIELGCGWGCWLVNTGSAGRARGLDLELIGIEGSARHLEMAQRVLETNGFGPDSTRLHHGIAGPRRGTALFPADADGAPVWDGSAVYNPDADMLARARSDPATQVLDVLNLADLAGRDTVDLLHIDIQGAELAFVQSAMSEIAAQVRRVLIGTHSRSIEGSLVDHFTAAGWALEMERPAIQPPRRGRPVLGIDGVQMWRNPALAGG